MKEDLRLAKKKFAEGEDVNFKNDPLIKKKRKEMQEFFLDAEDRMVSKKRRNESERWRQAMEVAKEASEGWQQQHTETFVVKMKKAVVDRLTGYDSTNTAEVGFTKKRRKDVPDVEDLFPETGSLRELWEEDGDVLIITSLIFLFLTSLLMLVF
jgi:hypothetical protein